MCLLVFSSGALAMSESNEAVRPRHGVPFIYYLQHLNVNTLKQINPAVAVVDPYDSKLTPEQIRLLQGRYGQLLIAYLSVGEVDPTRRDTMDGYAFREQWQTASWLTNVPKEAQSNDRWSTRRVEYWSPVWQAILKARITKLIEKGYDGVMFDTVDTFGAFEEHYDRDVIQDMANLVGRMRDHVESIRPGFRILINGGMEVYDYAYEKTGEPFLSLIKGQLKEDTWHNEGGSAEAPWTKEDKAFLKRALEAGVPVFSIDYFTNDEVKIASPSRMRSYLNTARHFGAIPFAADRDLGIFIPYNREYFSEERHWDSAIPFGIHY